MKNKERLQPSQVIDRFREMILGGNLHAGEKLPSERALALMLGVGRPAVREAMKALQVLDIVESRHGDGTYIKSLAGLAGGWPAKLEIGQEDFDVIELLEVRKMIEPKAAGLAAARADTKQIAAIERELLKQEEQPESRETLVRHDYLFHEAIIMAAGNEVLRTVSRSLSHLLTKSRKLTGQSTPDVRKIVGQHRTIFEAIRRGEPDLAERAMTEHLQTVGLDVISSKSFQPERPSEARQSGRKGRRAVAVK